MLTRCPNCGAGMSLDALIAHEECRQLLAEVMQVGLPFGRGVPHIAHCRYSRTIFSLCTSIRSGTG